VHLRPGDSVSIVPCMPEYVSPEQARLDAQTRAIIAAREALTAAKIPYDFVGTNVTIVAPRNAPHAVAAVTIGAVTPERVSDAGDDEPVVDVGEGSAEPLLGGEVSEPVIPTRIPDVEIGFVATGTHSRDLRRLRMMVVVDGDVVLSRAVTEPLPAEVVVRSERRVALREPGPMGGPADGEIVVRLTRDQARHAEGACLGAASSWRSSARASEHRDDDRDETEVLHAQADRLVEAAEALGRAIVERDGDTRIS
jgi:hypothetical protein